MRRLHATEMSINLNQYAQQVTKASESATQQASMHPPTTYMDLQGKMHAFTGHQQQSHYQHIQLGVKGKNGSHHEGFVGHHQKSVSNSSSIAYPFQTSSINVKQTIGNQSAIKPTRTSQLIQEQIQLNPGKNRFNELLATEHDHSAAPALISIQATSIQKSPSPRSRQLKIHQFGQHHQGNSTTLSVGVSSLMPHHAPSRTNKSNMMQTDPKSVSSKQQEVMAQPVKGTGPSFSIKVGHHPEHQMQSKDQKDLSKRTIAEGFRKTSELESSGKLFQNRAQTGLQRRFNTQKASKMSQNGPLQQNIAGQQYQQQSQQPTRPQQELLDLGNDVLDKLDDETIGKISDIQRQLQRRDGNVDKNQILHLYRMSLAQNKSNAKHNPLDPSLDGFIKINQILNNSDEKNLDNKSALFSAGPSQSQYGGLARNQGSALNKQTPAPPKSANSNHYPQSFNGLSQSNPTQNGSNHTQKRESYNFVSQQQKQVMNSQEKLRRNLSKEYCPMIIKSTNKSLQGANNASIVKGVLQIQPARVGSSLQKTSSSIPQRHQQPSPGHNRLQNQSEHTQGLEIIKTQSHQVLIRKPPSAKPSEKQRLFYEQEENSNKIQVHNSICIGEEASPFHRREEEEKSNLFSPSNTAQARLQQQSVDDAKTQGALVKESNDHNVGQVETQESTVRRQLLKDLVTPGKDEPFQNKGEGQNAINEPGIEDYSPGVSPKRRVEDGISAARVEILQMSAPPLHGNFGQSYEQYQQQLPQSSLGRGTGDSKPGQKQQHEMSKGLPMRHHPGSAMTTIKSPKATQQVQETMLKKQMSAVSSSAQRHQLISSKQNPVGETNQNAFTNSASPGGLVHMNSRQRIQHQQNQIPQRQINNLGQLVSKASQYKLITPQQDKSKAGRMGSQQQNIHQMQTTTANKQINGGVRGSATLAQHQYQQQQQSQQQTTSTLGNRMNNNTNSQTNGASEKASANSRTASHSRHTMGSNKQANHNNNNNQQLQQHQPDASGGGFLRPKVLDFQPKTGQVDPLVQHRSRKHRGVAASGSHNHTPAINMSTGSAFNQHHHHHHQQQYGGQARMNTGGGVFRHF